MRRRDWVLAVLAAANGESVTPVQLQKALFLLGEECPEVKRRSYYRFTPYSYGPFDSMIYTDAAVLAEEGHLTISPSGYGPRQHRITETGTKRAGALEIKERVRLALNRNVKFVRSLSFRELISEIYRRYPEMRVRSVFS